MRVLSYAFGRVRRSRWNNIDWALTRSQAIEVCRGSARVTRLPTNAFDESNLHR